MLHILKEIVIGFFPQIALFRRKYVDTQSFFVIDWYSLSQKKLEYILHILQSSRHVFKSVRSMLLCYIYG